MPDKTRTLFLVVALIVGLLVGFAVSTLAYRHRWLHVPKEGIIARMTRELKLTPAQGEQIREVMQDTRDQIIQQRRHFHVARRLALWAAFDKIRALLNPDQQAIFDRDFVPRAARRPHWHHFHHGYRGAQGFPLERPPATATPQTSPAPPAP